MLDRLLTLWEVPRPIRAGIVAMVSAVRESPGWRDRSKMVLGDLSMIGAVVANMPPEPADIVLANADNSGIWLDVYIDELTKLRRLVSEGDHGGLDALLAQAQEICMEWLLQGEAPSPKTPGPEKGSIWRRMFLGGWGQRRPR